MHWAQITGTMKAVICVALLLAVAGESAVVELGQIHNQQLGHLAGVASTEPGPGGHTPDRLGWLAVDAAPRGPAAPSRARAKRTTRAAHAPPPPPAPPAGGAAAQTPAALAPASTGPNGTKFWKDPLVAAKANNLTAFASNVEGAGLGPKLGVSDLVATVFAPSERTRQSGGRGGWSLAGLVPARRALRPAGRQGPPAACLLR